MQEAWQLCFPPSVAARHNGPVPSSKPSKPIPTSTAIARASGVSQSSVSMILNGKTAKFHPDTVQRVFDTAARMGYRVNASARAMRSRRFGGVGLLAQVSPSWIRIPESVLWSIGDAVRQRGMHLTLGRVTSQDLASEETLAHLLTQWSVDGLLVSYTDTIPARMFDLTRQFALPTVWLNAKLDADCVYPDDFAAARELTNHLLAMGHRRVAFQSFYGWGTHNHYSRADRYEGYSAAMRDAGLQPHLSRPPAGMTRRDGSRWTASILSQPDRPTAILTYQNDAAVEAFLVAREMGLSVPGDLSIASFQQVLGIGLGVHLTAMHYPADELGQTAVEEALEKVGDPAAVRAPRVLSFLFDPGETAAPPKHA